MVFFATERRVCKRRKLEIRKSKRGKKNAGWKPFAAQGKPAVQNGDLKSPLQNSKSPQACLSPIGFLVLDFGNMEVTLHIPDDIAKRLSAAGGDLSRRALESIALEGYRDQTLTLYQISQMLGLSRVETEDFLGRHHVPLAVIEEADLDREAALFEDASRRNPR